MADEEFDIYGDYNFDQSDDILDEIVGDSSSSERKRQRPKEETEESETTKPVKVSKSNERQETSQKIQTTTSHHNSSNNNSNSYSGGGGSGGGGYQSNSNSNNNNNNNNNNYSRSQQLPLAITQLRGLSMHPTNSIYLGELHWYTTESQVKHPLEKAHLLDQLKELTFYEHKVNGKSKGIVFIEFNSTEAASTAKSIYEKTKYYDKQVFAAYTTAPNPFKHLPKETVSKPTRNNNSNNNNTSRINTPMMTGGSYPMNAFSGGFNGMAMPYFPMGNRSSFMGGFGDMMSSGGNNSQRGGGGGGMGNGGGRMRNSNPNYMNRMPRGGGGNGGNGGGSGNYMGDGAGFGGMYINPAFFEQQQQQQQQGHNNNN